MARFLRIRFPGAIYHVVMNSAAGRRLFNDQEHYREFTRCFREEAVRRGWKVFAYCWTPNQTHMLLQTPEPNLSQGMQYWLSTYTNWYSIANETDGDLFKGRYKTYMVQDASHFWELSRFIHLYPCQGKKPLAKTPEAWKNSSYAGFLRKSDQQDWIHYDEVHKSWKAANRSKDPTAAYRSYVQAGLGKNENPLDSAHRGFIIGNAEFVKKMGKFLTAGDKSPLRRSDKTRFGLTVDKVLAAVAKYHRVNPKDYCRAGHSVPGKDLAAFLSRRHTVVTTEDLSKKLGMAASGSSSGLVRRAAQRLEDSPEARKAVQAIERQLGVQTKA